MRGDVYIDDIDIFMAYGATITGGLESLFVFPAIKEPEENDWPEEDGIEIDLETVYLQAKEITLSFVASSPNDLIEMLSSPGYHKIRIPALEREWSLRLSSQIANKYWNNFSNITLKMIEDSPVSPSVSEDHSPGIWIKDAGYFIDGTNLAEYGIEIYGGLDEVLKSPTVKQNLLRNNISIIDGQIYDIDMLTFNSKDVVLKCLFVASNIESFWKCYNAFWAKITEPNERLLTITSTGITYPVYYKKSGNFNIRSLFDIVEIEFSITLCFTSFRVEGVQYVLAAENGALFITEDGLNYIDMNVYGGK